MGSPVRTPPHPHICQILNWAVGSSVYGNGWHERWGWRVGGGFLRKMCLTLSKISFMVAGFRSFEFKLLLLLLIVSDVRVIPYVLKHSFHPQPHWRNNSIIIKFPFDHLLYAKHCAKKVICIISFNSLTNPLRLFISWMRNWSLANLITFPRVTELIRAGIQMLRWAGCKLLYPSQSLIPPMPWGPCALWGKQLLVFGVCQLSILLPCRTVLEGWYHSTCEDQKIPRFYSPETCMRDGQAAFTTKTTGLRCVRPVVWKTEQLGRAWVLGVQVGAMEVQWIEWREHLSDFSQKQSHAPWVISAKEGIRKYVRYLLSPIFVF